MNVLFPGEATSAFRYHDNALQRRFILVRTDYLTDSLFDRVGTSLPVADGHGDEAHFVLTEGRD